jgi:hypothetical protein
MMIECPKCKTEYQESGSYEDDTRLWVCRACGFEFNVELEPNPIYSSICVTHDFGEWRRRPNDKERHRFCDNCGYCELEGDQ